MKWLLNEVLLFTSWQPVVIMYISKQARIIWLLGYCCFLFIAWNRSSAIATNRVL